MFRGVWRVLLRRAQVFVLIEFLYQFLGLAICMLLSSCPPSCHLLLVGAMFDTWATLRAEVQSLVADAGHDGFCEVKHFGGGFAV